MVSRVNMSTSFQEARICIAVVSSLTCTFLRRGRDLQSGGRSRKVCRKPLLTRVSDFMHQ